MSTKGLVFRSQVFVCSLSLSVCNSPFHDIYLFSSNQQMFSYIYFSRFQDHQTPAGPLTMCSFTSSVHVFLKSMGFFCFFFKGSGLFKDLVFVSLLGSPLAQTLALTIPPGLVTFLLFPPCFLGLR